MPDKKTKKNKKSVKVADLPKKEKVAKAKRPKLIHNARFLGLFFIAVITLLFGLLLFNLIVHFGFVDSYDDFSLSKSEKTANGSVSREVSFDPAENNLGEFTFTFKHPSNLQVSAYKEDEESPATIHVHDGVPVYGSDGTTSSKLVASFALSDDTKDNIVTDLTIGNSRGEIKEVDFAKAKATEVNLPDSELKYIIFENQGSVYTLRLDTSYKAEIKVIEESVKLVAQDTE